MTDGAARMIFLGFGKYVRADKIYALEPLPEALRGSGARTRVLYTGSVPDLFRTGRQIVVEGTLRNGTFVAKPNSLVTKCPSKYTATKTT